MTDNPLVEAVAKQIKEEARGFQDPVHLYVEGEALRRWLKANPDADYIDAPNIDWNVQDWAILATAALRAIEDAGWKVVKKGER